MMTKLKMYFLHPNTLKVYNEHREQGLPEKITNYCNYYYVARSNMVERAHVCIYVYLNRNESQ